MAILNDNQNNGDQYITFDFLHPATGQDFNTALNKLIEPGIYEIDDPNLSVVDPSNIKIPTLTAVIRAAGGNNDLTIRAKLRTDVPTLTIPPSTPDSEQALVMYFDWDDWSSTWVKFAVKTFGSLTEYDTVIGTITFNGSGTVGAVDGRNRTLGFNKEYVGSPYDLSCEFGYDNTHTSGMEYCCDGTGVTGGLIDALNLLMASKVNRDAGDTITGIFYMNGTDFRSSNSLRICNAQPALYLQDSASCLNNVRLTQTGKDVSFQFGEYTPDSCWGWTCTATPFYICNTTVDNSFILTAEGLNLACNLYVQGNLCVCGALTCINTTTLQVEDKNIELGKVAAPTDITADGGGITLLGDSDKCIQWACSHGLWNFNPGIHTTDCVCFDQAGVATYMKQGFASCLSLFTNECIHFGKQGAITNPTIHFGCTCDFSITRDSSGTNSACLIQSGTGALCFVTSGVADIEFHTNNLCRGIFTNDGCFKFPAGVGVNEIKNSITASSATSLLTENAIKTYVDSLTGCTGTTNYLVAFSAGGDLVNSVLCQATGAPSFSLQGEEFSVTGGYCWDYILASSALCCHLTEATATSFMTYDAGCGIMKFQGDHIGSTSIINIGCSGIPGMTVQHVKMGSRLCAAGNILSLGCVIACSRVVTPRVDTPYIRSAAVIVCGTTSALLKSGGSKVNAIAGGVVQIDSDTSLGLTAGNSSVFMANLSAASADQTVRRCSSNGRLYAYTVAPSSCRFKCDIENIIVNTSNLYNLQAKSFCFKPEVFKKEDHMDGKYIGFIAEEVNNFFPEVIELNEKKEINSIKYEWLTPIIVEEMKKLKNCITGLNSRIFDLEAA